MIILGIDPGTATTGYALIKNIENEISVIDYGLIETPKTDDPHIRLNSIFEQILNIIDINKPHILVMEKVFFATNAKTVIRVGQAQGVILLSAAKKNIKVMEYAPMTIKKMITGSGKADKKTIQKELRKKLGNNIKSKAHKKTHFDNAADALAIALCHVYKKKEENSKS